MDPLQSDTPLIRLQRVHTWPHRDSALTGWLGGGAMWRHDLLMDVLSSRVMLRPRDVRRAQRFYRDVLGLAVYREFGDPSEPGVVFFLGNGLLEISPGEAFDGSAAGLWLQVRDLAAEHRRLVEAGVIIVRAPALQPWGLWEMWLEDPDGLSIVLVEIPADHPLRRDARPL